MKVIYDHQAIFLKAALAVEASNGFNFGRTWFPVDIDDKFDQERLKGAAWRVVEEIQELTEALQAERIDDVPGEVADVICFTVNMGLMTGLNVGAMPGGRFSDFQNAIYHLGLAMNELKNRQWRSTHTPTDMGAFNSHMVQFLGYSLAACEHILGGPGPMLEAYLEKKGINEERHTNGY